jgi:LSD1 subclass zinc finger protein
MAEALKCPSCAAPLEMPPGGGTSMRCPYCNTTVMLGDKGPASVGDFAPAQNVVVMRQIADLLGSGDKIAAIRIYRQAFGGGLAQAKMAVEKMGSGRSAGFDSQRAAVDLASQATQMAVRGAGRRMFLSFIIMLVSMMVVFVIVRSTRNQIAASQRLTPMPSGVPDLPAAVLNPFAAPAAPVPPEFAKQVLEFGSEGIGAGQFKDSRSVAVDNKGNIFVGEYSDGRIQVFDSKGDFVSEFTIGSGKSLLNLTADHQGNLYVVLPGNIIRYDTTTHMPQDELENHSEDTDLSYMDAFAALNGDVYAISGSNIVDIGPDGKIKSVIDEASKIGESVNFDRIVVSGTLDIYTLARDKGVFKFAPDGRYINRWGEQSDPDSGKIVDYENIAIDGNGHIYVSGFSPAITVYDSSGQTLGSFGGNEVVFGLTVDDQNEIFASFRNLHAVRKFVLNKN